MDQLRRRVVLIRHRHQFPSHPEVADVEPVELLVVAVDIEQASTWVPEHALGCLVRVGGEDPEVHRAAEVAGAGPAHVLLPDHRGQQQPPVQLAGNEVNGVQQGPDLGAAGVNRAHRLGVAGCTVVIAAVGSEGRQGFHAGIVLNDVRHLNSSLFQWFWVIAARGHRALVACGTGEQPGFAHPLPCAGWVSSTPR